MHKTQFNLKKKNSGGKKQSKKNVFFSQLFKKMLCWKKILLILKINPVFTDEKLTIFYIILANLFFPPGLKHRGENKLP